MRWLSEENKPIYTSIQMTSLEWARPRTLSFLLSLVVIGLHLLDIAHELVIAILDSSSLSLVDNDWQIDSLSAGACGWGKCSSFVDQLGWYQMKIHWQKWATHDQSEKVFRGKRVVSYFHLRRWLKMKGKCRTMNMLVFRLDNWEKGGAAPTLDYLA